MTRGQVLFSDGFERNELGPDWRVLEGAARVEGGGLHLEGPSNVTVACTKPFPGDVRLEYEGYVVEGSNLADISCFLCSTAEGGWGKGYFFGFGSYLNTDSRIKRFGQVKASVNSPLIERSGRVYRIAAERLGAALALYIDGEAAVRWEDPDPLGPEHCYVGLYSFGTHVVIARFVVTVPHGAG